jgi:uracil-DNA glycosylase
MAVPLRDAMRDILAGWQQDLDPAWRAVVDGVELGYGAIDPALVLEPWEPVFPVRRGRVYMGAPKGAHIFRAFDGIAPDDVRVVILGQDPYPCGAFSTGRAFEAGNVAWWRELEKMFSVSVRTYMQMMVAARTGKEAYAASTAAWRSVIDDIETGRLQIEPAAEIADRWLRQGVLLLNSALTISRFKVEGDPHQLRGHLPLWRPFIAAVLTDIARRNPATVFIAFGGQAVDALHEAGIRAGNTNVIIREHPARGNEVLSKENPFLLANSLLAAAGGAPVSW